MRTLGLLVVWLCTMAGAWCVAPAEAQQGNRDSAEYREAIRKALEEYRVGNYHEAKLFFSDAHAMFPNARTLRGLGLTAYALRDYVGAAAYFEQSLDSSVQPLSSELRASVDEFLERAKRFIAHVRLNVDPPSAEVRIDERPVVRGRDGTALLNPGPHELVATAPGHDPVTRRWTVEAGARSSLDITLPARGMAAGGAPADPHGSGPEAPLVSSDAPAAVEGESSGAGAGPWVLIGTSGALAIGGGVLLAMTASDIDAVEEARQGSSWASVKSAYDRAPGMSIAGFAVLGVGLAGVTAGLIWQLSVGEAESVAFHLSPSAAGVRGSF